MLGGGDSNFAVPSAQARFKNMYQDISHMRIGTRLSLLFCTASDENRAII